MTNDKSRKRVEKLFSEMEQPASKPDGSDAQDQPLTTAPSTSLLWEVEELRSRVRELETQLKEKESNAAPLIYEKEEVGFAYAGNRIMPVKGNQQPVQQAVEQAGSHRLGQHERYSLQIGFFLPFPGFRLGVDQNGALGEFLPDFLQRPEPFRESQFRIEDADVDQSWIE